MEVGFGEWSEIDLGKSSADAKQNPDSGVQMAAVPLTVMVLSAEVTVPPDPSKALSYGSWVEHPEIVLGNAV